MKKWILIYCHEHDIEKPIIFNTKEEAAEQMYMEIAEVLYVSYDKVMEIKEEGDFRDGVNAWGYIGDNYAYVDTMDSHDWRIFEI